MAFQWKKYQTARFKEAYDGLRVSSMGIYLSNIALQHLGTAEYVTVEFDTEEQAILVSPAQEQVVGAYKASKQKGANQSYAGASIRVKLMNVGMPKGRYMFSEETPEGCVFIKETVQI